jgi:hypothetical protein
VRYKKKPSDVQMVFTLFEVESIIPLLASRIFSKAIVIEGAFGDGARISILNHCPKLLFVEAQNGYSGFVLFKLGKFLIMI